MKFRTTFFAIISGIFINLNSANAFSEAESNYYFHSGGISAICGAYSINAISEEDASMLINKLLEMAKEDLKDSKFKDSLNNFVRTGFFKEIGCSKLIN